MKEYKYEYTYWLFMNKPFTNTTYWFIKIIIYVTKGKFFKNARVIH